MTVEQLNDIRIRKATEQDHDALKIVCLKTGDSGADATTKEDDPDLLGLIYAVPYQVLEPDFAFVAEDDEGVCGTTFGALDTVAFAAKLEKDWFAPLRTDLRNPGPNEKSWQGSDWARYHIHHPPSLIIPELAPYPSHGHIDLLPRAQGRGLGRKMITQLTDQLIAAGSKGMHFDVSPVNHRAIGFYQALGFTPLQLPANSQDALYLVRSFS